MFCPNCGREVSDGAKFCPYCGNPLTTELTDKTQTEKENTMEAMIHHSSHPSSQSTVHPEPSSESPPLAKRSAFKPIYAIIIAFLVVAAIIGSVVKYTHIRFTLTPTGAVSIISTPSGANAYLNGEYKGTTPLDLSVLPNSYTLRLTKDGYEDYERMIAVDANSMGTVYVALEKPKGTLSISSTPDGATVSVDGQNKGTTPLNLTLLPGSYSVKVTKTGYKNYAKTVTVGADLTTKVNAVLERTTGTLSVASTPTGATVYINNQNKGKTPLKLILSSGSYSVKITKDGYEDYTKTVTVTANSTTTVNAALEELTYLPFFSTGTLYVDSYPFGATVYINGENKGKTPLELTLSAGSYSVKITKDGYEDYTTTVAVGGIGIKSVYALLEEKANGTLFVLSYPFATVYINNENKGETPLTITLPPGTYLVRVTKKGYKDYIITVTITPNSIKTVNAALGPI